MVMLLVAALFDYRYNAIWKIADYFIRIASQNTSAYFQDKNLSYTLSAHLLAISSIYHFIINMTYIGHSHAFN